MADANRKADSRPDPDALLALAGGEGRGKLTAFPRRRARRRQDLRDADARPPAARPTASTSSSAWSRRTAAPRPRPCSTGWKCCRAGRSTIRAGTIEEFDLDAALARRPRIIIVDELAHTNAPDSRHPKRYQDIEELLAAGIDVWTALNIQHLESLSDVVAQHHRRRRCASACRTSCCKSADDVLLVDLRAGRTDRAAEGRQGLSARECPARRRQLLPARQSDRAARTGAAPHRRPRRRPDGRLSASRTRSKAPGRRPSGCWSASAPTRCRRRSCAPRAAWRRASTRPGW